MWEQMEMYQTKAMRVTAFQTSWFKTLSQTFRRGQRFFSVKPVGVVLLLVMVNASVWWARRSQTDIKSTECCGKNLTQSFGWQSAPQTNNEGLGFSCHFASRGDI